MLGSPDLSENPDYFDTWTNKFINSEALGHTNKIEEVLLPNLINRDALDLLKELLNVNY
jgi:hypothetical protein